MKRRGFGIDGVKYTLWDLGWFCLGIAGIIACAMILIASLFAFDAVMHPSRAQDPQVGWQLGICIDDQFRLTTCRLIGSPLPDEQLCRGLQASLKARINAGRIHCTRILIDGESE